MKFKITEHDKEALCRQAPEFAEVVRQTDLSSFECCENLFLALVQSIVSQQLALKAADAIFRRVETLLGEVTAGMLLIFALGRPDVLSFKDLGIRRGIMILNHLDDLTEADFEIYRKRYSPYGTLASLYLWRIKDGGLSVGN